MLLRAQLPVSVGAQVWSMTSKKGPKQKSSIGNWEQYLTACVKYGIEIQTVVGAVQHKLLIPNYEDNGPIETVRVRTVI